MKTTLAFYIGRGTWVDHAIRLATGALASHVELLAPYAGPRCKISRAVSSSPRDGGVRIKEIEFKLHHWLFIDLAPWHAEAPFKRAATQLGAGYDWRSIALTHALPLRRQCPGRFTCSELIGTSLGLRRAALLSPGALLDQVIDLNAAYEKGRSNGRQTPS